MKNKVTMVIPVYNSEKYIGRCLESVLNQTYKDIDILVINDGSKDNSQKIINEFAKKYKNITAIEQENMGVARTRNKAIQMTETEYIMFMDNDDFIDNDYIETLLTNAEEGQYDIVVCGYKRPTDDGKIIRNVKLTDEEFSKYNVLAPWAKIYKTDFLKKNNLEFLDNDFGEDTYLNLQAYLLSDKTKVIDYTGYNWFYNIASVSNTKQKNSKNVHIFYFLDKTYDSLKKRGLLEKRHDVAEYSIITNVIWYLFYCTKGFKYKEISDEYDKAFDWLKEHFPEFQKNKYIGFNKAKGQLKFVRTSVAIMMFLNKIHLGKLAIYIYSKI